ncbi:protein RGF1 INDUCIBLE TRANSCRIPTION FACTOR 1-like [Typha angustifolia]|uniref:protein RGF1 INDUCIBLE TRANSCRIPTION FACTOR 1-like n=1 Tax=Typha angustifolia TaxID=59011 RepID=UPI003C2AC2EA
MRKLAWLDALIGTQKFFVDCSLHEGFKKKEKNICCLDCCTAICTHCLPSHSFHRLIQVRRYVYHDVVRLQDLEKLIDDCSGVQSYTINSSKVVFIKKRSQSRQFKGSGNVCTSCDRILQEPYIHCSLECKVNYVLRTCKPSQFPHGDDCAYDENNETTQSTVIEGDEANICSSSDSENLSADDRFHSSSGINLFSRFSRRLSSDDIAGSISRRKGIPHRSPLC